MFSSRPKTLSFTPHPSNRDALSDLALHFLNKMKIMVVKDIEREDIEFICKVRSAMWLQRWSLGSFLKYNRGFSLIA